MSGHHLQRHDTLPAPHGHPLFYSCGCQDALAGTSVINSTGWDGYQLPVLRLLGPALQSGWPQAHPKSLSYTAGQGRAVTWAALTQLPLS